MRLTYIHITYNAITIKYIQLYTGTVQKQKHSINVLTMRACLCFGQSPTELCGYRHNYSKNCQKKKRIQTMLHNM